MHQCSKCGHQNPDSDKYCQKCGAPISRNSTGPNPTFHLQPIPAKDDIPQYPLGESAFFNLGMFSVDKVNLKKMENKVVLRENNQQVVLLILVGASITGFFALMALYGYAAEHPRGWYWFHYAPRTLPPIASWKIGTTYKIALGFLSLALWVILFISLFRLPRMMFDKKRSTLDFFTGKTLRLSVAKKEIATFSKRTIQSSRSRQPQRFGSWVFS